MPMPFWDSIPINDAKFAEDIEAMYGQIVVQTDVIRDSTNYLQNKVSEALEKWREERFEEVRDLEHLEAKSRMILPTIEENILRLKNHSRSMTQVLEDGIRLQRYKTSLYRIKREILRFMFVALIGYILYLTGFGYQLMFRALLQININFWELTTLYNWQKNNFLLSQAISIIFYASGFGVSLYYQEWSFIPMSLFRLQVLGDTNHWRRHQWNQYLDMKKPRPFIPIVEAFAA